MSERRRFDPTRMSARTTPAGATGGLFPTKPAPDAARNVGGAGSSGGDVGQPPVEQDPSPRRLTVSQLAAIIDRTLRDQFTQSVRVVGEIGQFRERTHWYFDLKDADALISCVMFAGAARKAGFTPEPGQEVVATGRVEFYTKQGRTTFMVERLEPVGEGALELAFRKLCGELRGLGWFDEDRKRPLPAFPRRVAVVTSATGAALQDVLDTLRRRSPMVEIATVDVRVQGENAAAEVARAVRSLSRRHRELGVDLVLVTRGGGSREDLWAFNDRELARAIVECEVPVVAAIGHETDTTIAELVADLRCATPTQAAVRIAPDATALTRQLESFSTRLDGGVARLAQRSASELRDRTVRLGATMRSAIGSQNDRLARASARLERHRPVAVYAERHEGVRRAASLLTAAMSSLLRRVDLDSLDRRLQASMQRALARSAGELSEVDRALELVGPAGVLRRGYSVTLGSDGKALRSSSQVSPGDQVVTRLADGAFESRVVGSGGHAGPSVQLPPARESVVRRRRKTGRTGFGQTGPGLFGA